MQLKCPTRRVVGPIARSLAASGLVLFGAAFTTGCAPMSALPPATPVADAAPAVKPSIKRTVPSPTSFLSTAVTVPPGAATTYFSGQLAAVSDHAAPAGSFEAYGDTKTQTLSVLKKLQAALEAEGLGFGDVVSVRVFLAGDPKLGGKLDFAGLQAAYTQFFGTAEQPMRPTRTALQVAALPAPWALVEIDCIAAKVAP